MNRYELYVSSEILIMLKINLVDSKVEAEKITATAVTKSLTLLRKKRTYLIKKM